MSARQATLGATVAFDFAANFEDAPDPRPQRTRAWLSYAAVRARSATASTRTGRRLDHSKEFNETMMTTLRFPLLALAATVAITACAPPATSQPDASSDAAAEAAMEASTADATSPADATTVTDTGVAQDSATVADSGSESDASAPADAGAAGDSAADAAAPDAAAPCNSLAYDPRAVAVPFSMMPGSVAVLNGGTIPDATYYAASAWSSGATGTIRAVWRFTGTTLETLEETTGISGANAIAPGTRGTFTVSASGSTLTLTARCGTRPSYMPSYAYNATTRNLAVTLAGGRVNFSMP